MKIRKSNMFGVLSELEKTTLRVIASAQEKWILVDAEFIQFDQNVRESGEMEKIRSGLDVRFN